MTIGVLREGDDENRVVLLPEHVASLVKKGIYGQGGKGCRVLPLHRMKVILKRS